MALILGLCLFPGLGLMTAKENNADSSGWTCEETMKVSRVSSVQVSPDGKKVTFAAALPVMTDEESQFLTQIYLGKTDGSGYFQFTHGTKSSSNPQWSPDGAWLAFISERSGKSNIWIARAEGGEACQLTDVKTGVGVFKWSPDGSRIAFVMQDPLDEEEDKAARGKDDARIVDGGLKMSHLWIVPANRAEGKIPGMRRLTGGDFTLNAQYAGGFDWSPDGRKIVFTHTTGPSADLWTFADISQADVETGKITPLVNSAAAEFSPLYSPDGKRVAFLCSENPPSWDFSRDIHIVNAEGGKARPLARTADRNSALAGWAADSRSLFATEVQGTANCLLRIPVDGGAVKNLTGGEQLVGNISLNNSGEYLGFTLQDSDSPEEVFISASGAFKPVKVSDLNSSLPKHPLGKTETVRWKSGDGLEIEGLLTYPVGYERGKKYPLLLIIHGGPMGVFTRSFIGGPGPYPIAVFASEGYAVLRCNIRGSSGYGREFLRANYSDWGGKDYQDLISGIDHLVDTGLADPERLGVMGWSYGGFMSSWIITQTARFKAASIGAPVTNLISFTGTTDILSFIPGYFGGEFWDMPGAYLEHSPMFKIKGVTTPSLIQHGESDVRVPFSQGMELYTALKRQGVEVQMVAYPREGHGFQEPKHILDTAIRNVEWFRSHIPAR